MKIKELKSMLVEFPEDAKIYVNSDYTQASEIDSLFVTNDMNLEKYIGEFIVWEHIEAIKFSKNKITAILIM